MSDEKRESPQSVSATMGDEEKNTLKDFYTHVALLPICVNIDSADKLLESIYRKVSEVENKLNSIKAQSLTPSPESPTSFDESVGCKHPDAYNRTKYEGDKLVSGTGYCRDCEQTWTLNAETRKFEPTQSPRAVSDERWWVVKAKDTNAVPNVMIVTVPDVWRHNGNEVFQVVRLDQNTAPRPSASILQPEGETGFDRERLGYYVNNPSAWIEFDQDLSDEIKIAIKRIADLEAEVDDGWEQKVKWEGIAHEQRLENERLKRALEQTQSGHSKTQSGNGE